MDVSVVQLGQIALGKPLARGATADVYPWEAGCVLKLFYRFSQEAVQYEARVAGAVHASGMPVPRIGDMVQVNGQYGLIYERVDGSSMFEAMKGQPWRIFHWARRMAAVQAHMHGIRCAAEIPSQRERLVHKIRAAAALPDRVQTALLERLKIMPDGDWVCHGDFHPGNILLTARGEVVIDWIDAAKGNPLADVARTTVILLGAAASSQIPKRFEKEFIHLFHRAYLRHYFRLRPGGEQEYRRWLPIVAAARLNENVPGVESWLVQQATAGA